MKISLFLSFHIMLASTYNSKATLQKYKKKKKITKDKRKRKRMKPQSCSSEFNPKILYPFGCFVHHVLSYFFFFEFFHCLDVFSLSHFFSFFLRANLIQINTCILFFSFELLFFIFFIFGKEFRYFVAHASFVL